MSELDEMKAKFEERLEKQKQAHSTRVEAEKQELHDRILNEIRASQPAVVGHQTESAATKFASKPASQPVRALVNMASCPELRQLDFDFINQFHLDQYYPDSQPQTYTQYCDTLEEYCEARLSLDIFSEEARDAQVKALAAEFEQDAKNGKGEEGIYLESKGAFINGWLFGFLHGCTSQQAYNRETVLQEILRVTIHEKLGHGFLSECSEMGKVEQNLGIIRMKLVDQFSLQSVDDPIASLRYQQGQALLVNSLLLEEGWATWVQTYPFSGLLREVPHPTYNKKQVEGAIEHLPHTLSDRQQIQEILLGITQRLLGEKAISLEQIHTDIMSLERLKKEVDDLLANELHQTLRYVIGELLFWKAEQNLGPLCVPYMALIAANLNVDTTQIGLADLTFLLMNTPRLHPDTRLAAISRIRLDNKDDVGEMVTKVYAQLSFSIPDQLKKFLA